MPGLSRIALLAALLCLAHPASAEAPTATGAEVPPAVSRAIAAKALAGARVGVLLARADDGEVLFERHPDRSLVPASNAKILTALAVLDTWGPTHQFETAVHSDAPPDAKGGVTGLTFVGSGDPAINSEDWWRVADALRSAGVRSAEGPVRFDDSAFDSVRWHPRWGKTGSRAYHAPVSGLSANYGAYAVHVRAGAAGIEAFVVPPVDYFQVEEHLRAAGSGSRLRVDRRAEAGAEVVTVTGAVAKADSESVFYRSVLDPTRYAAAVARAQLSAVGIANEGDTVIGAAPALPAHELLRFEGRPLSEIVRLFMKYSNNNVAESLLKALGSERHGAPGTWEKGSRALREQLLAKGLDGNGFNLIDGSGLARDNRVSPRTLVTALRLGAEDFRIAPEWKASLPIAGRDGTLARRSQEGTDRVRAKTGLIDGVAALSGFAEGKDGEELVFSILVNGYKGSDWSAMQAVDALVAAFIASDWD